MTSFEESRTRASVARDRALLTPVSELIRVRFSCWRQIDSVLAARSEHRPRNLLAEPPASSGSLLAWDDQNLPPFNESELENAHLLLSAATEIYRMRRARDQVMPAGLVGEPAWDILLALYSEESNGLTVSSVCHASGVSQASAMRWIEVLQAHGLVERAAHERDARIVLISMTEQGRVIVEQSLKAMLRSARE